MTANGLETDRGSVNREEKEKKKALGSSVSWWHWGKRSAGMLERGWKGPAYPHSYLWALKEANMGRWTDKCIGEGWLLSTCPYLCIVLFLRKVSKSVVQI